MRRIGGRIRAKKNPKYMTLAHSSPKKNRMKNIIENGTILFKNGLKKNYDVISLTEKGVYIGYKEHSNSNQQKYIDQGFIPKDQIQKILVFDKDTRLKEFDFKDLFEGGKK